jgi:hypothetical protein
MDLTSSNAIDQLSNAMTPKKKRKPRMPPFVPSQAQRNLVSKLIAMRMQWDEIRLMIINPRTQEPISKTCLSKHFKKELAAGSAALRALVTDKYFEALTQGRDWAIRAGLRNRFRWTFEGSTAPDLDIGAIGNDPKIAIEFVLPSAKPKSEDQPSPIVDVTPQEPPDYSRHTLEPPRPRQSTPFGVFEQSTGSAFEQPDPKGWMK